MPLGSLDMSGDGVGISTFGSISSFGHANTRKSFCILLDLSFLCQICSVNLF